MGTLSLTLEADHALGCLYFNNEDRRETVIRNGLSRTVVRKETQVSLAKVTL